MGRSWRSRSVSIFCCDNHRRLHAERWIEVAQQRCDCGGRRDSSFWRGFRRYLTELRDTGLVRSVCDADFDAQSTTRRIKDCRHHELAALSSFLLCALATHDFSWPEGDEDDERLVGSLPFCLMGLLRSCKDHLLAEYHSETFSLSCHTCDADFDAQSSTTAATLPCRGASKIAATTSLKHCRVCRGDQAAGRRRGACSAPLGDVEGRARRGSEGFCKGAIEKRKKPRPHAPPTRPAILRN